MEVGHRLKVFPDAGVIGMGDEVAFDLLDGLWVALELYEKLGFFELRARGEGSLGVDGLIEDDEGLERFLGDEVLTGAQEEGVGIERVFCNEGIEDFEACGSAWLGGQEDARLEPLIDGQTARSEVILADELVEVESERVESTFETELDGIEGAIGLFEVFLGEDALQGSGSDFEVVLPDEEGAEEEFEGSREGILTAEGFEEGDGLGGFPSVVMKESHLQHEVFVFGVLFECLLVEGEGLVRAFEILQGLSDSEGPIA